MANKRINVCCVLLSVILCAAFLFVSVTESYARYAETFSCRTILVPGEKTAFQSDYLVKNTDAQQTVIVGELSAESREKSITFTIESSGDSAGEILSITNEHGSYVEVSSDVVSEDPEQEARLEVPANDSKTVTLSFKATDTAFSTPHEKLDVDVNVAWGDLTGTFRVLIPAVEAPQTETAENPEGSSESGENLGLSSPEEQEASETSEPAEEDSAEQDNLENGIMSISIFDASALLPVKVTLKDEVTEAVFGLFDQNKPEPQPFPEGTRFSLDNGESFYMFCGESTARIEKEDLNGSVLFDFSKTALLEQENISVAMQPWESGTNNSICSVTVSTGAEKAFGTAQYSGEEEIGIAGSEDSGAGNISEGWKTCTLDRNETAEFFFPTEWADAELSCSVQILNLRENGTAGYDNTDMVATEYRIDEETGTPSFCIRTGENNPQAGAYRIYLIWKFKDIVFLKTEIPFFINYSTPSDSLSES
ncbi:MAG: hypothetical protein IJO22_07170 [Oscillospiraceae bacterium]|nr:hypothetical protein [Oscillospiraceae bacterium]